VSAAWDLATCPSLSVGPNPMLLWSILVVSFSAASSSRSQVAARATSAMAYLTWERPSVDVRWRPSLAVAIVTQLVTRSLMSGIVVQQRTWRMMYEPDRSAGSLDTADPGGTLHQGASIAPFAAAQARFGRWGRAAARMSPSILNVVMPTQVALPPPPPWIAAHCGCCHLAFRPCHPRHERSPAG